MPTVKPKADKPQAYLSVYKASEYLAKHLKERTANLWYGYLKHNPKQYLQQDGYKVVCHVIDGKACYTEASLKAFIKAMGSAERRKEVTVLLDQVDVKKTKTSKISKPTRKKAKVK